MITHKLSLFYSSFHYLTYQAINSFVANDPGNKLLFKKGEMEYRSFSTEKAIKVSCNRRSKIKWEVTPRAGVAAPWRTAQPPKKSAFLPNVYCADVVEPNES